jgi:hypothetical protein
MRRHKFQLYLFQYHQASFNLTQLLKLKPVEEKRAKPTFLPSIYTITATRVCLAQWWWERFKEKRTIASVLWCERKLMPSNTKTARKRYQNILAEAYTANGRDPDSLVSLLTPTTRVTTPRVNLTFRTIELK